jgi:hypothetical protein
VQRQKVRPQANPQAVGYRLAVSRRRVHLWGSLAQVLEVVVIWAPQEAVVLWVQRVREVRGGLVREVLGVQGVREV